MIKGLQAVARIFLGLILCCQLVSAQNTTKITVDKQVHDFGKIKEKVGQISHSFTIKNEGSEPLSISQVISSCNCITSKWSNQPVPAGGSGKIEIFLNPEGRPGLLEQTVSIHSNGSKSPLALTLKANVIPATDVVSGTYPVFTPDKVQHDFGMIQETDGLAYYSFKIKNTGTAPLVISHVQSSCGCAEPEWTVEPIEPGKAGQVTIIYDPNNRPGPFQKNITVYTNEQAGRQRLAIKGDVVPKPRDLNVLFHDSIGTLQLEQSDLLFYTMRPRETSTQEFWIRNFGNEDLNLSIENTPQFLDITIPDKLEKGQPDRLKVSFQGSKIEMRGRLIDHFTLKTTTASGSIAKKQIRVVANFIDDFSNLTVPEKISGPTLELSSKNLDYGKIKKGGFLGIGGNRVYKEITLTNTGKAPLTLHSVTTDDPKADITGFNKKALAPKESTTLRIFINPKEVKGFFGTFLYIICNDAKAPIHEVHITAER